MEEKEEEISELGRIWNILTNTCTYLLHILFFLSGQNIKKFIAENRLSTNNVIPKQCTVDSKVEVGIGFHSEKYMHWDFQQPTSDTCQYLEPNLEIPRSDEKTLF